MSSRSLSLLLCPESDNDMAINGNDLPSSLADKHALEAATSVSEQLILNKLGLMYTL